MLSLLEYGLLVEFLKIVSASHICMINLYREPSRNPKHDKPHLGEGVTQNVREEWGTGG